MSNEIFKQLSKSIEFGKLHKASPFPPDMRDQNGADDLTLEAFLEEIKSKYPKHQSSYVQSSNFD